MSLDAKAEREVNHVAIIMDGNGRWAQKRGLPRLMGHKKGVEQVREVIEAAPALGITHLTLFAFSTENWKRSVEEVSGLMALFRRYILTESANLQAQGARVRFIGDRSRLGKKLVVVMEGLEAKTALNDRIHLTVAINYGGRDEITRATTRMAEDVAAGMLAADDISQAKIEDYLDTAQLPDPDLVIRTSGETRISNFMLWQMAYSEFEFVDTYWPDFTADDLETIMSRYGTRERRFGAVAQ